MARQVVTEPTEPTTVERIRARLAAVEARADDRRWYHVGLRPLGASGEERHIYPAACVHLGSREGVVAVPVQTHARTTGASGDDQYVTYPGQLVRLTPAHARAVKLSAGSRVVRPISRVERSRSGEETWKLRGAELVRLDERLDVRPGDRLLDDYVYVAPWPAGGEVYPHMPPLATAEIDVSDATPAEVAEYARLATSTEESFRHARRAREELAAQARARAGVPAEV